MTAEGKATIEKWKGDRQRVVIYSQGGQKVMGVLVDYDDTEIVLETRERNSIKKIVCHNWFYVQETSLGSCHD